MQSCATFLDYHRVHVAYFVTTTLLCSGLLCLFEGSQLTWVDSWFTTTSAMTVTGLGVVDFTLMKPGSKVVVAILICFGGQVAFALVPLSIRRIQYSLRQQSSTCSCTCPTKAQKTAAEGDVTSEMDALVSLSKVILVYGLFWTGFGFVALSIYCSLVQDVRMVLDEKGVHPIAFAAFTSISAFNNAGFSLFSNSLVPLQDDTFVVLVASALITAGNTLLPVLLRWGMFGLWKITKYKVYEELLKSPRRFTTHVFDSWETLWLFGWWCAITTFQFALYSAMPYEGELAKKTLDMFFTTISTRTAGFNVIDLEGLQPGILVLQVMLMYLSSYPFIVAVKSTARIKQQQNHVDNPAPSEQTAVLEASETGEINREHENQHASGSSQRGMEGSSFEEATYQLKKTLSNDAVWLAVGTWLIAMFNSSLSISSLFRLIWEVVSAYGNVGSSLATPEDAASFASSLSATSKLLLVAIMIAGRHRGMPHSLDAAVSSITSTSDRRQPTRAHTFIRLRSGMRHHTIGYSGEHNRLQKKPSLNSLFIT